MRNWASFTILGTMLIGSSLLASTPLESEPGQSPRSIHVETYENLLAQKFKDYPPELKIHMQRSNMPLADSIKWLQKGYQKSISEAALACTAEMETFADRIIRQLIQENNIVESRGVKILEEQIKEVLATRREIYNDMYRGVKPAVPYEDQLKANFQLLAQYGVRFIELLSHEGAGHEKTISQANEKFSEMLKELMDKERTREQYKKVLDDKLAQARKIEELKKLEEQMKRELEALNLPKAPKTPEKSTPKKGLQDELSDWEFIE